MVTSTNTGLSRHRVREGIQSLILGGEFRPGDRLIQQDLARRFGVAQSVIREALLELQFSGLVHTVDRLGVFVSRLNGTELLQAYEVREMLEGLGARLCCTQASRADRDRFRKDVEAIRQAGQDGDMARRGQLDREFHSRIVQRSGNPMLIRLYENHRILGMAVQVARRVEDVYVEHLAIVNAIEGNQADEAERTARLHVQRSRDVLEGRIQTEDFRPDWVVSDAVEEEESQ